MTPELLLDGKVSLYSGDCIEVMGMLPDNSIDACVVDPPYHLTSITKRYSAENAKPCGAGKDGSFRRLSKGFMGRTWDGGDIAFRPETWALVLRVLKPGGHIVAFSGTRTYHRMACAIEDSGFEIRDMLQWLYGSGFPKSHNVAKAVDETMFRRWLDANHERRAAFDSEMHASKSIKRAERRAIAVDETERKWKILAGCARAVIGRELLPNDMRNSGLLDAAHGERPAYERNITESATDEARAAEGWGTAFKPALEPICFGRKPLIGTVAENFMEHGTGAINIDACRVGSAGGPASAGTPNFKNDVYGHGMGGLDIVDLGKGRWPANVIHDGSAEVVESFPETAPSKAANRGRAWSSDDTNEGWKRPSHENYSGTVRGVDDAGGSAARFFYTAKADVNERLGSKHPTVKPTDLMQWLVRSVTPKGGTVLDPFAGTGTTGEAAWREGMRAILIEREPEYQDDIRRRMSLVLGGPEERHRVAMKPREKSVDDLPLFGGAGAASGGG